MTRLPPAIASVAVASAIAFAGCGGEDSGDGGFDPAAWVPPDAPVFVQALVRPDEERKKAIEQIARSFPGNPDIGRELERFFDEIARDQDEEDFDFKRDVEAWVGDRVGFFASELDESRVGAVVEVDDQGKAEEALERDLKDEGDVRKRSTDDVDYSLYDDDGDEVAVGFIDDVYVSADEESFKAVAAARRGKKLSLAGDSKFRSLRDELEGQKILAFAYGESREIAKALEVKETDLGEAADLDDPTAVALDVEEGSAKLDLLIPAPDTEATALEQLPDDASIAFELGDLSEQREAFSSSFDSSLEAEGISPSDIEDKAREFLGTDVETLLGSFGQTGFYLRLAGLTDIGGAVVTEIPDAAAGRRIIRSTRRGLREAPEVEVEELPDLSGDPDGFALEFGGIPFPVIVAANGERAVLALGADAAERSLAGEDSLEGSEVLARAERSLGQGFEVNGFIDVAQISRVAGPIASILDLPDVAEYLDPIDIVAFGSGKVDGRPVGRITVEFDEQGNAEA